MSKKEERIFERNPDTGEIRSRKPGDYGNERIERIGKVSKKMREQAIDMREEILNELWGANKKVVNGKWYIELSQAIKIIGR
jgi:hypothetical protein